MTTKSLTKNSTTIYLWPIFTLFALLIFKHVLLGISSLNLVSLNLDLIFLAIIVVLALQRESVLAQRVQWLIAGIILFLHWLDACIIFSVHDRLTFNNVVSNIGEGRTYLYFISWQLIVFTLITLGLILVLRKKTIALPFRQAAANFMAYEVVFISFLLYLFVHNIGQNSYGAAIDLTNNSFLATSVTSRTVTEINKDFPAFVPLAQNYLSGKTLAPLSTPVNSAKPNIIILLSESLSGVDSKYAGGLFNRLPMIDKVQQEGTAFTRLVSNGRISNAGLGALLLGVQPIKTGGYSSILKQFPPQDFPEKNIVAYAKKAGYKTIVICGTSSSWQGVSAWFKQIGFDEVYDKDSSVFANVPRYTWDAPNDEAMYTLAQKLMAQQQGPYLLLIETMSLHQPYILPDTKYKISDNALLNQIHYVDVTTNNFYQDLKKNGFFNNGVLLALGDHRRFESLEEPEVEAGGYPEWHERIVGFMVGKNIPAHKLVNTPYSQLDLNSLQHVLIASSALDDNALIQSTLARQLDMETIFTVTLAGEDNGTYLIRSEKYPPMYVSIFGNVPFNKIPGTAYQKATAYLILNDKMVNRD